MFDSTLHCRKSAKKAAVKIECVEYSDDPVPRWFNYHDFSSEQSSDQVKRSASDETMEFS